MIDNKYVIIMVLYHPISDYGFTEVLPNIQCYICLIRTLFLYTRYLNNIFTITMLEYLVNCNSSIIDPYI